MDLSRVDLAVTAAPDLGAYRRLLRRMFATPVSVPVPPTRRPPSRPPGASAPCRPAAQDAPAPADHQKGGMACLKMETAGPTARVTSTRSGNTGQDNRNQNTARIIAHCAELIEVAAFLADDVATLANQTKRAHHAHAAGHLGEVVYHAWCAVEALAESEVAS